LDYQGQNIYGIEVNVPLGNYVYRFLIDGEEYETDNNLAKKIVDGVEFNTLNVRENDEESEEDHSEGDKNGDEQDDEDGQNGDDANKEKSLVYDQSTGQFVVSAEGKKKRRGRPSMEIELPSAFVEDAQQTNAQDNKDDGISNKGNESENKVGYDGDKNNLKKDRKKKKKTKKNQKMRGFGMHKDVDLKQLFKQKEEEWARMVFVQQLRQQQQHNDEINRVKTLWKQERQVRVEMHKKLLLKKKNYKKIV